MNAKINEWNFKEKEGIFIASKYLYLSRHKRK